MDNLNRAVQYDQKQIKRIEIFKKIERKEIKKKGFWIGFWVGFFITYFIIGFIFLLVWVNFDKVVQPTVKMFLTKQLEDVVDAIPESYVTRNKEKVLDVLDKFANGAEKNKITKSEFNNIAVITLTSFKDKKLTYKEIDSILKSMEDAVK